jgi:hypothetical protein
MRKTKNYFKTSATIVGNDIETVDDPLMGPKHFFSPIIEFMDSSGERRQLISGENNPDRPLYTAGDKITVLINPADSTKFLIHDYVNGYVIPIIWIVIGLSVVIVPYLFPQSFR